MNMMHKIYFKKGFLIFFIFSIFFSNLLTAKENKILFKVNNEIITSLDLLNEINYLKIVNKEFNNTDNITSYEIAKNSIIREKIKQIEILKYIDEIKIDEKVLNDIILNNFNYLNIKSMTDFHQFFLTQNIEPSLIKQKISIEIIWNQLIFSKFNNKVKINIDEIKNKLINEKQNELFLSEILFELKEGEKLDEKFKLIKKTINEKGFAQAVLIYSISDTAKNDGQLGWIKETLINKNILKNLINVNSGDFSEPIVVPGGFLILKIGDKRIIKEKINLEKEFDKILKEKRNQQLNQLSNIYFNKIKKDFSINEL